MVWVKRSLRALLALVVVGCFLAYLADKPQTAAAAAGINSQMSFQGKVVKSDGTNIADGTYNMEFKIYQDGTGTGGGTLKWTEDRLISATAGVTITSGTFQVNLGSITGLSAVDFNQNTLWLSMQVGSTTSCTVTTSFQTNCGGDGEMAPYIRLTASPYAINSDKLDGMDAASFVQLSPSAAQSGFINLTGNVTGATLQGVTVVATTAVQTPALNAAASGGTVTTNLGTLQRTAAGSTTIDLNDTSATNLIVKNSGAGAVANLNLYNGSLTTGATPTTRLDAAGNATLLAITATGNTLLQPTTASAAAFVVQASGPQPILTADTLTKQVLIGSATADANQVNLQLDSYNAYADAGTCTTTTSQGSLYYNTVTAAMRACINGSWEDLISTGGLGLLAFGVVPDSANAGSIGDLAGITQSNSPCKVYWASATSVQVAPCFAYSGGRKIQVLAGTVISTSGIAANTYMNICLTGTNGQPALVGTGSTTEGVASLPTWSQNNPILCLATLLTSTTAGTITNGKIYDVRTFTTTQKTFATLNSGMALGTVGVQSAVVNQLTTPGAAAAGLARGVLVAYSNLAATTNANAIIATAGPQWVKATGTSTASQYAQIGATNGYTSSVTAVPTAGYSALGVSTRTIDTTCTSNTTCQYSQFLNPLSLR